MSYLVLARKYRPQTFDEIVGQEHVTQTLKNALSTGRIHHAFLFTGARGVGKTTAARILAKALSCALAPTATPCNACDACREITQGSSVDVQEIDAASNNGVDNVRELRDAIRYAPVRGKKKVYILDEVHMLSGGAWNALLKTLEEPPPHAVFVFATTDPHKLPATILSRVQRYDFKLVPSRRIVEHLTAILEREKIPFQPGALSLVAREAGGSVRDSLSLLDQVIASVGAGGLTEADSAAVLGVADRGLLFQLARAVLVRDAATALGLIDAAFTRGYDLSQLSQAFLGQLRDLVVAQALEDPSALIDASSAEIAELKAEAKRAPAGLLEVMFDRFAKTTDEVARSPVPRYVLEVGLIELMRTEPLEPMSTLIGRLEGLEGRLERGSATRAQGTRPAPDRSSASSQPSRGETGVSASPAPDRSSASSRPETGISASPAPGSKAAPTSFTEIVEAVLAIEPRLSALAQGRLVSWKGTELTIGFDRDFAADGVRERLPLLRSALHTITGRELTLAVIVGAAEDVTRTATLIEVEQRKIDEDRERRVRESLEHPVRKTLDEQFGGSWRDPVVDNVEND
jgi:DNA polymerase-3 subunit gamma/tau